MWRRAEIRFELDDDATEHPTVTIVVRTPLGEIAVMGDLERVGRALSIGNAHVQGAAPNALGIAGLIAIARAFLEEVDADEIVVQGAVRTTGRGEGRRPRPFRYRR